VKRGLAIRRGSLHSPNKHDLQAIISISRCGNAIFPLNVKVHGSEKSNISVRITLFSPAFDVQPMFFSEMKDKSSSFHAQKNFSEIYFLFDAHKISVLNYYGLNVWKTKAELTSTRKRIRTGE